MGVAKWTERGEGHRGFAVGDFQSEVDMHAALRGGEINESRHSTREEQTRHMGIQGSNCYFQLRARVGRLVVGKSIMETA